MPHALIACGVLLLACSGWLARRRQRLRRVAALVLLLAALASTGAGAWLLWLDYRAQPPSLRQELFQGMTYIRDVRREPARWVIHVVKIDLGTPGLRFLVTPPQPTKDRMLAAQTTSRFLAEHHAQAAVNASFFRPFRSNGPLDYYPHEGDAVDPEGLTVSRGQAYAPPDPNYPTLFIAPDGRVSLRDTDAPIDHAVSGSAMVLIEGELALPLPTTGKPKERHPRTAAALDKEGKTLLLIVVDGRQKRYSVGVTFAELAAIIGEHGGWTALNLDGGGSSTLVAQGPEGTPVVLNSPIHNRIPGCQRAVATHLGVFAPALATQPAQK